MFDAHCSKLMLDYFGISNMYVNHVIAVTWVILRSVFGEANILFSTWFYCFGLWFLQNQIYHFYYLLISFLTVLLVILILYMV